MTSNVRRAIVKFTLFVGWIGIAHAQSTPPSAPTEPLKVLFIGSSLTYMNGLPSVLASLSAQSSETRKIEVADVTFPSWTLTRHWGAGKALNVIRSARWDFVVLQPGNDQDLQDKATELFSAEISAAGAKTIIYVIFPRQNSGFIERPVRYFEGQIQVATALGALSAPVGPAWALAVKDGISSSALYDSDGRHPTLAGTYLAACVFFAVIYGRSPENLRPPWIQDTGSPSPAILNSAAWRAVQEK